jgi:hypothetical protein
MSDRTSVFLARLAIVLMLPLAANAQATQQTRAQAPQPGGTLVIAGQPDQAVLVRMNGKAYVDIESLARITHGSVKYQGSQTILTLPGSASATMQPAPSRPPQLSEGFLGADIEALTQIREWRVALVNAIQNNYPVTDSWVGRLRRSADSKLQLAVAAATTDPDQKALDLLRNEFTNMLAMSDGFVAMQTKDNYIAPGTFDNNSQDKKILDCEHALVSMAATKQFQDDISCH